MAAELIKIDRNGSKHWRGMIPCDRCGGQGGSENWKYTGFTCYKCGGSGVIEATWIERTPEYEAKLDAKRQARREAMRAQHEAAAKEYELARKLEEERIAKEKARIEAEKAVSQWIGEEGQKISVDCTFVKTAWYTARIGFREDTIYVHTFKDVEGNKIVWKTQKGLGSLELNYGEPVTVSGTVKEHGEYDGEKQTYVIRCKIEKILPEKI